MKYQNKQNGTIVTLGAMNEKFGTVELIYEDNSMKTISNSTFKRWWKKLPEEETTEQKPEKDANDISNAIVADFEAQEQEEASKYVEVSQQITKELNKNNSKSLEQMVESQAEAGKEIAEQAKNKSKGAKRKAKSQLTTSVDVDSIVAYISNAVVNAGGTVTTSASDISRMVCKMGEKKNTVFYVRVQKSSAKICAKEKYLTSDVVKLMHKTEQSFNCRYKIEALNDDTKKVIDKVINAITKKTTTKEEE